MEWVIGGSKLRVDHDAGLRFDPAEVLADTGEGVRHSGLAAKARDEAGHADGRVFASPYLDVERAT